MTVLIARSNDALNINPTTGSDFSISVNGSDWLWTVTAIYCFCLLVVVGLAFFARSGERIFHYLTTISLFVGTVAYFTMASDLGWLPIETSTNEAGYRQVFYAKYINWFVGWTPLITAVGLISGVSWATIIYNLALSWTWVACWFAGAVVSTVYKWGFFAFGTFAYILLAVSLVWTGSVTAKRVGVNLQYYLLAGWLSSIWLIYLIAYGVDEGNKISVTSGFIFYGILDILTVPCLSCAILVLSTGFDYRAMNIYFTQYGRVKQSDSEFPEKAATAAASSVVTPEQAI